mmetsp:Transcript_2337/g.5242  ORF Transcript_2337/g.5242 Transcript_2337/m.5242 type:complete len:224 (+) Transcript_2337:1261-1932(+)
MMSSSTSTPPADPIASLAAGSRARACRMATACAVVVEAGPPRAARSTSRGRPPASLIASWARGCVMTWDRHSRVRLTRREPAGTRHAAAEELVAAVGAGETAAAAAAAAVTSWSRACCCCCRWALLLRLAAGLMEPLLLVLGLAVAGRDLKLAAVGTGRAEAAVQESRRSSTATPPAFTVASLFSLLRSRASSAWISSSNSGEPAAAAPASLPGGRRPGTAAA